MRTPENKQYVLFGGSFVLANKLQAVVDSRMGGITTKQWFLLRNLMDLPAEPCPTITILAKETDTSRQNVRKMLEILQKQGCVVLHPSAEDRRSQTVEMTEYGRECMLNKAQDAQPFFAELFQGITQEETRAAAGVVIKMIENLQKMQEEATE